MPRKAKKGGEGSQTEEERLLLQQRRAQTEEEVTRQREEMLTLFLKVIQLFLPLKNKTKKHTTKSLFVFVLRTNCRRIRGTLRSTC